MGAGIKERKLNVNGKPLFFWGSFPSEFSFATPKTFTVTHSFIQKETSFLPATEEELEKRGRKLYQKYLNENNHILQFIYHFYQKAGTAIYDRHLAIIAPGFNGYLTIDENGIFKWVSFDGMIYDTIEELLVKNGIREVSLDKKEEAIKSIMGVEKQTSFTLENLTLIANVKEGELSQTIYQNDYKNKDIKPLASGFLCESIYGYGTIYEGMDGLIKADNLAAFATLYENKDLYIMQQAKQTRKGRMY